MTDEQATLIVHSYAGGPAFQVAARTPELSSTLVLIDSVALPQPKMKFYLEPAAWLVSNSPWAG